MRSEARKVHDLFFDLLGVAFSDTDFRDARNALTFNAPVSAPGAGPSSRQNPVGLSKRQKPVKDVDSDNGPFQKPQTRGPIHTIESSKARPTVPTRARELSQPEDARLFTHPLDLVICKKKRKDREKSAAKSGNSPLSPTGIGGRGIKSPGSISGGKEGGPSQLGWYSNGENGP